jgi:hypothetical protein
MGPLLRTSAGLVLALQLGCAADSAPPAALPPQRSAEALAWADAGTARLKQEFEAGSYARFAFDKRSATLRFLDPERDTLALPALVVGTYSPSGGGLLWGWADTQLSDELRAGSVGLSALAAELPLFGREVVTGDPATAKALAAVAAEELGGFALFGVPQGELVTYLAVLEPAP